MKAVEGGNALSNWKRTCRLYRKTWNSWRGEGKRFSKKLDKLEKPIPVRKTEAKAKAKITKKPVKISAAATVLAVIKRGRKGVDIATLKNRTGLKIRFSLISQIFCHSIKEVFWAQPEGYQPVGIPEQVKNTLLRFNFPWIMESKMRLNFLSELVIRQFQGVYLRWTSFNLLKGRSGWCFYLSTDLCHGWCHSCINIYQWTCLYRPDNVFSAWSINKIQLFMHRHSMYVLFLTETTSAMVHIYAETTGTGTERKKTLRRD